MDHANDGLFNLPYTTHDWLILSLAISGTLFRIFLIYFNKDSKNPKGKDWMGIVLMSFILTIGLYELAIHKKWTVEKLYLPFAMIIIVAKDLTDWLFMSKDGKQFVIGTFKTLTTVFLGKLGYTKNEDNENNSTNFTN